MIDFENIFLLDYFNYQPDNFGTYMVNAYLNLASEKHSGPTEAVINAIKELFSLNEHGMDLAPIPELLLSDDFKNLNSEQYGMQSSAWAVSCFDLILEYSYLRNDPFFKSYRGGNIMSPCKNLTRYPECEGYCTWHEKITAQRQISKHDFLSMMRYFSLFTRLKLL